MPGAEQKTPWLMLLAGALALVTAVAAVAMLTLARRSSLRDEILVITAYPGASAGEVLHRVTMPIEEAVARLREAGEVRSTSTAIAQQMRKIPGVTVIGDQPLTEVYVSAESFEAAEQAAGRIAAKVSVAWDDRATAEPEMTSIRLSARRQRLCRRNLRPTVTLGLSGQPDLDLLGEQLAAGVTIEVGQP